MSYGPPYPYGTPPYQQTPYGAPAPGGNYPPAGGYPGAAPPGGGAPVGADPQLWQWFTAVDVDQSGAISAQELRQALLNGDWNFDLDTVKMLMTLFDVDRSGTITFDEFAGLWKYIRDWQNVFRHFDADRSGSIDGRELKNALEQFGYRLTPKILRLLEIKYGAGESRVDLKPGMTFDRFVRACVATKHVTESFQRMDEDRDGWVQMNYEQFMTVVLTAP
ncbi:EF-hand [Calocera viscosa TUFC12733]|uniref:EF-hand n=1 Tax=Calocera viscosa (strain TUFC12733) TaxID=1330018 RepID=A0A167P1A3_CALVF|nr:EF-hand [Calocera viscosa TUFC12733]